MTMNQDRIVTTGWSLGVLVLFLAAWEWGPALLGVPDFVLPNFTAVCAEAVRIWGVEKLLWHAGITAAEVVIGFVLGSLLLVACCVVVAACCMLRTTSRVLRVACCMLPAACSCVRVAAAAEVHVSSAAAAAAAAAAAV